MVTGLPVAMGIVFYFEILESAALSPKRERALRKTISLPGALQGKPLFHPGIF